MLYEFISILLNFIDIFPCIIAAEIEIILITINCNIILIIQFNL